MRAPAPSPKQITLTEAGTPATPPAPLNINKRGCDALIGISLGTQRARVCRDQLADQSDGPTMAGIPGGAFEMGGDRADEQPKHRVQIRYSLGVARFETSVGEFRRFCDATGTPMPPDTPADPKLPIANVSWDEANKYSAWLSQQTGAHYRLPSEAEWEFFARAGVTSRWPDGENNFNLASIVSSERVERTAPDPVAHGASNRFNLVHILGNVAEWVEDAWRENYNGASTDGIPILGDSRKVTRGGSFKDKKERITLSARVAQEQSYRATTIGFRLVRDLQ